MQHMSTPVARSLAVLVIGTLAACGGDDAGTDAELSPAAQEGKEIVAENGCVVCHGSDGEGGTGPAWVGLFGSEVSLEDGSTVVADREYLRRAIADPGADIVDGYSVRMPTNSLESEEIERVVDYIESLAEPT